MIFGAINSLIQGKKQKKMARGINPVNDFAEVNQPIQDLYTEGRNLYQGKAYGQNAAEQGLLTQNANYNAGVQKNATSGSQAIAAQIAGLGSTNQGFVDLGISGGQEKQNRFGVMSNVSQLLSQEQDKVHQDKLRNYYDDLNYKRGLEGAAMQNNANFWGGLDNTIGAGLSLISPGGLLSGKVGGGGGGNTPAGVNTSPYTMTRPNYQQPNIQRGQMPIPSNRSGLSY